MTIASNVAAPSALTREVVQRAFPGAILAQDYIDWSVQVCAQHDMTPEHTLPILVTCRDEVITDYKALVTNAWGLTFSGDSLGGAFTMGRTGLDAARRHVPEAELPVRVAFFVFPHVGIDSHGVVGNLRRQGRLHTSRACGAIITMHEQFVSGHVRLEFDPTDPEMSLLRQRIAPQLLGREVPDLVTMTAMVRDASLEDLLATGITTGGPVGDLAIFSGILVNGPEESTWVWSDIASFRRHDTSSIFDLHAAEMTDS